MPGRWQLFTVSSAIVAALVAGLLAQKADAQRNDPPAGGGLYTLAQAKRGGDLYFIRCGDCHNTDLKGDRAPALTGERFFPLWEGDHLDSLFTRISTFMPRDDPGALTDESYVDILAYMLQAWGLPAGNQELTLDALERIPIPEMGGPGRGAIRNFKMVEVVGCLSRSGNSWTLTNTGQPKPTADQPPTSSELKEAAAKPLGSDTFRLVSVAQFKPDTHQGHKVQAKGLLYVTPTVAEHSTGSGPGRNDRLITVTSLQTLTSSCPN